VLVEIHEPTGVGTDDGADWNAITSRVGAILGSGVTGSETAD